MLSPFPAAGAVNYQVTGLYSVFWNLVLDFWEDVHFVFSLSRSSFPSLFHTVPQSSLSPLSVLMSLQGPQGICWNGHVFLYLHIISGLLCSSSHAEDQELCVVLFTVLRDSLGYLSSGVCGEFQMRWQPYLLDLEIHY